MPDLNQEMENAGKDIALAAVRECGNLERGGLLQDMGGHGPGGQRNDWQIRRRMPCRVY